jgi:hypothetical protein
MGMLILNQMSKNKKSKGFLIGKPEKRRKCSF